jgi:hypothetical protein
MDLTGALLRAGAARPHVLVVTMPGATAVRLAAEEQLRRRGWPEAMTPADADILLVCGDTIAPMAAAVAETWQAMPAPRARASASCPEEMTQALEAARAALADRVGQRAMAAEAADGDMDMGHAGGSHLADMDMGGMDMGDMGDMGDMDMGGMIVRGMPMARPGEDRDGLRLDQLHLPFGPVLPDWPAGLLLRLTLQGDVIREAEAVTLGGGDGSFWDEPWRRTAAGEHVSTAEAARRRAAARLDSLARLLGVAHWSAAATTARRLRDDVLAGAPSGEVQRDVRRFSRRVARSRLLAWLTGGLGELSAADAAAAGVTGPAARAGGDVTVRYRRWCAELDESVAALEDTAPLRPGEFEPPRGPAGADGASAGLVAVLPRLLAGTEFAGARLIVASLDPDLDQLPAAVEVSHDH